MCPFVIKFRIWVVNRSVKLSAWIRDLVRTFDLEKLKGNQVSHRGSDYASIIYDIICYYAHNFHQFFENAFASRGRGGGGSNI